MEGLLEVMDGRRIVHFHTHRHDDILTALRLGEEFGFTPVLHHVSEGWKVADEIAAAGAPASIIVLDSPGGKLEADDLYITTGAVLEKAGVDVAYHTDDYITDSRLFLRSAAFGVRGGMSREKALESLTLAGARMLGLADRLGSLEPGKDADFLVLSGDPLSTYTHVEQTCIDGRRCSTARVPRTGPTPSAATRSSATRPCTTTTTTEPAAPFPRPACTPREAFRYCNRPVLPRRVCPRSARRARGACLHDGGRAHRERRRAHP